MTVHITLLDTSLKRVVRALSARESRERPWDCVAVVNASVKIAIGPEHALRGVPTSQHAEMHERSAPASHLLRYSAELVKFKAETYMAGLM